MKNSRLRGLLVDLSARLESGATVCNNRLKKQRAAARVKFVQLHANPFGLLSHILTPRFALVLGLALLTAVVPAKLMAMPFVQGAIQYFDTYAPTTLLNVNMAAVSAGGDAGKRLTIDLDNGKATRYIQVLLTAQVDIAGAVATSVINFGAVEALFDEMGIREAGSDVVKADPRALALSSMFQLNDSAHPITRLTSTAIATTTISRQFRIWMENPRAAVPRETLFLEKNVRSKLQFFCRLSTATTGAAASSPGSGRLLTAPGGCTVTLSNVTVRVEQIADSSIRDLPLFRPEVDQLTYNPAAINADTRFDIPLDLNHYLRGVTVLFDTNAGLSGFVSEMGLRDDGTEYFGQGQMVSLGSFTQGQGYESGGDVFGLYGLTGFHINFQKQGRLSNMYNPTQGANLRLRFNVTSVPAGATVIIVRHMLVRDRYVDATGRRIMAETLPPELQDIAA